MNKKNALIIFTRVPIPGLTKTRLLSILTPKECMRLHFSFLKDISNTLSQNNEYDPFLFYSNEGDVSLLDSLFFKAPRITQQGNDLGTRMKNAIEYTLSLGYHKVALMGTDVPEVTTKDIQDIFNVLDSYDLGLGLSKDGGYYIISMKTLHPQIFQSSISWGSPSVIQEILSIIPNSSIKNIAYINSCQDIDTEKDLYDLAKRLDNSTYTGRFIQQVLRISKCTIKS